MVGHFILFRMMTADEIAKLCAREDLAEIDLRDGELGRVDGIAIKQSLLPYSPAPYFEKPKHYYDAPGRTRHKKGKR